ncbi:MAG: TerC family protein [Planctomycetaceae bacterium]
MEAIAALLALTLMEIVLGIDNIIFITILTDRLPEEQQPTARRLGLLLAMGMRIGLLFLISILVRLTAPWFLLTSLGIPETLLQSMTGDGWEQVNQISGRDLILLLGGLFLIRHSVREIHEQLEGKLDHDVDLAQARTFSGVLVNIAIMDIIFSLDSVITAVGMTENLPVMITAVVLSVLVMMLFAGRISRFVRQHPTLKMLALSFLILIGVMLVADAAGTHVNKGYIYFAMAFSLIVEALNIRVRTSSPSPGIPPSVEMPASVEIPARESEGSTGSDL